jgi:hypothetical protein
VSFVIHSEKKGKQIKFVWLTLEETDYICCNSVENGDMSTSGWSHWRVALAEYKQCSYAETFLKSINMIFMFNVGLNCETMSLALKLKKQQRILNCNDFFHQAEENYKRLYTTYVLLIL